MSQCDKVLEMKSDKNSDSESVRRFKAHIRREDKDTSNE